MLLSAHRWIAPEENLSNKTAALREASVNQKTLPATEPTLQLTGARVKTLRKSQGWTQRELSAFTGQGLISLIEKGDRASTPTNPSFVNLGSRI